MTARALARPAASALALVLAGGALAGCTDNRPAASAGANPRSLAVTATDTECQVSATQAPAGPLTFTVTNGGAQVTEFYLLGSDGLRILGEVENIGPGLTRDLVVAAQPGQYFTACKPGMVGEGIRAAFTVDAAADAPTTSAEDSQLVEQANREYQLYVKDQTEQLLAKTKKFAALYTAKKDAEARALYADARTHWERIEPVAESFGDLDPKMDAREADLQQGETWTGWHLIEKDLWPQRAKGYKPLSDAQRKAAASDLVANTQTLYDRTRTISFTVDQIANGAKALLDEVATGKVTGEEEYWSRTDLYDFAANVDGARVAWQGLRPILTKRDKTLDAELETRFAALDRLLAQHRSGSGYVGYDKLSDAQIKQLSDAVNALSEPLSKLTAAVI